MSSNRDKRDKQRVERSAKDTILRFCIRTILISIGLGALGVFVIANNTDVIRWVIMALGIILLIDAVIRFTKFFIQKEEERQINLDVFRAAIGAVVGVLSIICPYLFENLLFILIGVIITVEGALQLQLAFNRRHDFDTWIPNFFIGLLCAVIGVVIIVHPMYASAITGTISIVFGISILVTALMNLFASFNLLQMRKRLSVTIIDVDVDDID